MKSENFIKLAAIASFLGAITTTLLIFLPTTPAEGFSEQVALHLSNLYMSKLWILFLHPQFNLLAAMGVAFLLVKKSPALVVPGILCLCVWAFAEMAQQAFMIDTVNLIWRPEYFNETDELKKNILENQLAAVDGFWMGFYFLVQYGFGLGTLLIGLALLKLDKLAGWLGYANIIIGTSMILAFMVNFLDLQFLLSPVNIFYGYAYPYLQPAVRIGLGVWLLMQMRTQFNNSEINSI